MITDLNHRPGVLFTQSAGEDSPEPAILIRKWGGDIMDLVGSNGYSINLNEQSLEEFIKALRKVKAMELK